jgi:hypothetical protein
VALNPPGIFVGKQSGKRMLGARSLAVKVFAG